MTNDLINIRVRLQTALYALDRAIEEAAKCEPAMVSDIEAIKTATTTMIAGIVVAENRSAGVHWEESE